MTANATINGERKTERERRIRRRSCLNAREFVGDLLSLSIPTAFILGRRVGKKIDDRPKMPALLEGSGEEEDEEEEHRDEEEEEEERRQMDGCRKRKV